MNDPMFSIYGSFSKLAYTPWTAIEEFIDNSLSSWMTEGQSDTHLEVDINWEQPFGSGHGEGHITITDNAFGISEQAMDRAFKFAVPPTDNSKLARFGLGMKTAACWLGNKWTVETTTYGETLMRTIRWDNEISKPHTSSGLNLQETVLDFQETGISAREHFTRIMITELNLSPLHGRTIAKIKVEIAKVFRKYIKTGDLIIRWNGEVLEDTSPGVLEAPAFNDQSKDPESVRWETEFDIDLKNGQILKGYAYLFEKLDRQHTGLNFFWHDRLIKGNIEPYHRPQSIFGPPNSFRTGRLYIELVMDDIDIAIGKTNFDYRRLNIDEETLIDLIKEALNYSDLPISILKQAELFRGKQ
jgi:hypothetical protein